MIEAEVRLALLADIPQVAALANSVSDAPRWTEAAYRGYVECRQEEFCQRALFIAHHGGSLLGFAAANVVATQAELESIAVEPVTRRAGVGSALLGAVLSWALLKGAVELALEVRAQNQTAQAFYAQQNFRKVGCRPRYYSNPQDDAVVMSLYLGRN